MTTTTRVRLPFYSTCVDWPRDQLDSLRHLCDNDAFITRETFLKHVDREEMLALERSLGYEERNCRVGLVMANDYHVSYHKCGPIYFFRWSAIEHVFATKSMVESLTQCGV